ncbi:VOC family protein [Aliifodinibius sp. S!AR15-10]|uniref:VOC family protein n=1 Tax=Aliifodinibius sp. S!AR15-10 TaxID=2950437 RepID=UPI00286531C6|nr:VOC family protein [Aliifodinibius sp. S!AR15-10]MDR8391393.1 VOC family protein [Aliifodinibius sp. S!AR15-10]
MKTFPDKYHTATPYLLVEGVAELTTFLENAFDAVKVVQLDRNDGSIMHVEVKIGDSIIMMGEPMGEFGPLPGSIYLGVEDCDAVYQKALDCGGESIMEPTDMFHAGERYGGVKDPAGNIWWVATHIEDVAPEEQQRRIREGRK